MRERFIQLRKEFNLSQTALAEALGVSRTFINLYENGNRDISDRTVKDFCRIYNINESWLRTGEGDMYAPLDRESEIAQIVNTLYKEDDPVKLELVKLICSATHDQLVMWVKSAKSLINSLLEYIDED